eukprot:211407-Hanusia_phi.AAC.1
MNKLSNNNEAENAGEIAVLRHIAAGADDAGFRSSTTGSDAAEVWRAAELVKYSASEVETAGVEAGWSSIEMKDVAA